MITGQQIGGIAARGLGMQGIQAKHDTEMDMDYAQKVAPDRCLITIIDRVAQISNRAAEVSARLEITADRVFGGRPIGNGTSSDNPPCVGEIAGINEALDALSAQIARAQDAMIRLESL